MTEPEPTCPNCGQPLAPNARFCRKCGAAVEPTDDARESADEELPWGPAGQSPDIGVQHEARAQQGAAPALEGPPGGESAGRSRGWSAALAVAACALLGGAAAIVSFIVTDSTAQGASVVLEPVDYTLPDEFVANLDDDVRAARRAARRSQEPPEAFREIGDPREDPEGEGTALAGRSVTGSDVGIYGGSRDERVCDVERLVGFLTDEDNSAVAQAWAETLGVAREQIPEYVEDLTAMRLTFDTRVTNHGYEEGRATPFQALLQAGTAVLVDSLGVPRVKCNCGNPLLAPAPASDGDDSSTVEELAANPEDAWQGLDPEGAVSVTAADEALESFTIIDLDERGSLLERRVGSDGRSQEDLGVGDVQITLEWFSDADLDLHVVDPNGIEIFYGDKAPIGTAGELDVDANRGCGDGSLRSPTENVYWPLGTAPRGEYEVRVHGYNVSEYCSEDGRFRLTIKVFGEEPITYEGQVRDDGDRVFPLRFPAHASGSAESGTDPTQGESAQVTAHGIDGLWPGMHVDEAEDFLGAQNQAFAHGCGTITTDDGAIDVLVLDDEVAVIHVNNRDFQTPEQIRVGDSVGDVRAAYDQLRSTPHPYYPDGEYLTYDPPEPGPERLLFDIDNEGRVANIRAGMADAIMHAEFCA